MSSRADKLLVMSVFGKESASWHQLQQRFLNKTTTNFEHAVYLNNLDHLDGCTIVGSEKTDADGKLQHYRGLLNLLDYARSGVYRGWLVLDCDCFPIHPRWESILSAKAKNASIVRFENLDTFNHPSAVYCTDGRLDFKISNITNILGETFSELHACGTDFFPLIRTNRLNKHPVMAGVYYDLFYHHCAGSRKFFTRSCRYYQKPPINLEAEMRTDPDSFIDSLVSGLHDDHILM